MATHKNNLSVSLSVDSFLYIREPAPSCCLTEMPAQPPSGFVQAFIILLCNMWNYRKIYFRTNSSARTYISGVTFLAFPATTFRTT